MKRDMKNLEDQADASARAASAEKQHALQLEEDLKKICAELDSEKKEAVVAESASKKTIQDMSTTLNNFRLGIQVMTRRIFGK